MNRKGFTLIELMIVIAIIAIIAAIAIPGILAATRAANERNASGSLKQMGSVEVTFKTSDTDQNAINDYWTQDVAGLYYVHPSGAPSSQARMIELAVCLADGNINPTAGGTYETPANPAHLSSPKAGYWFQVQTAYEDTSSSSVLYGNRNIDRFSFIAYPNAYGSSGKNCFILSEGGTQYKKDPGSQTAYASALPAVASANTDGTLNTNGYNRFPFNPNATTGIGAWSKMD